MYNSLTKVCEVKFLTFKEHDPGEVNKVYEHFYAMMMACVTGHLKMNIFDDLTDVSKGPAGHNLQATQSSLVGRFQGLFLPVPVKAHFMIQDKLLKSSWKM
ncbi:hypothetical protein GH733_004720, partial [Mirounga leonina]